jgi:hypothetical protein
MRLSVPIISNLSVPSWGRSFGVQEYSIADSLSKTMALTSCSAHSPRVKNVKHANMHGMVLYEKGIVVTAHKPDLIELSELMVEYPGLDLTKAGMNAGWYYRVPMVFGREKPIRNIAIAAMTMSISVIFPRCTSLSAILLLQRPFAERSLIHCFDRPAPG